MTPNIHVLWNHLAISCLLASLHPASSQMYDAILQQALIASLGVERPIGGPPTAAPNRAPSIIDDSVPPYMLELYSRYKSSGLALEDGSNAVRCFKSRRGSNLRPDLVFFNLDSIALPHRVVRAELHFNRRKTAVLKDQAFRVSFYDVRESSNSADITTADTLGLSQVSHGWQAIDITSSAKRAISKASEGFRLGVTLTPIGSSSYRGDALPLSKGHSRPFILVYTNESANLTEDQISSRIGARGYAGIHEETKHLIDPAKGLNQRTKEDVEVARNMFFLRHKRDMYDNEIPGDPDVSRRKQAEINGKIGLASVETGARPKQVFAKTKDRSSEQLIPWPRPSKHIPGVVQENVFCGRKQLVLDFKDIGWDNWIIEPKGFEANYCSGQCTFPDMMGLNPSNHATLQSLLYAVGVRSDLPTPCCVPDKLSSVTMLYFDSKKNVILKTYPNMAADSCACR